MEREAARAPSVGPRPQQSAPTRPATRTRFVLPLAACIVVAALVVLSSYGGGARLGANRPSPQLAATASSPPENPPVPAQPTLAIVQVAAAEAVPPQATPPAPPAPQEPTPAAAALPDHTELLQKMARDLATLERNIEQLRATQQQMASDNSKAIAEVKASQEEIKRALAKVSEQNPPKTSPPPTQPTPALRKPERMFQSPPYARVRPRYPREWMYDDW